MTQGLEYLISTQPPPEREAFAAGYDSAINGANETNCHFTIFTTQDNTRAWERGAEAAKQVKARDEDSHK